MTKVDLLIMGARTCELAATDYPSAVKVLELCKFAEPMPFWKRKMACGIDSSFQMDRDASQASGSFPASEVGLFSERLKPEPCADTPPLAVGSLTLPKVSPN